MDRDMIADLSRQVIRGRQLTRDEAETLAAVDGEDLLDLFRGASRIRTHFLGNRVHLCSIVAAKVGRCSEDCAFCSQSAHYATPVQRPHSLSANEVCQAAEEAAGLGAHSFGVVNSGRGPTDGEIDAWAATFRRLSEMGRLEICASLGTLTQEQANRLGEVGVRRYNHNLQTSRDHFSAIVTTHDYDARLETLGCLRQAGVGLCCGALFGMGESWSDRLDLAFELRELEPEVVPINFLIPIEGTPLSGQEPLRPMECLKIIAVYRFLLPRAHIKVAGGRESNLRDLQSWIFLAGASGFLIGNYLTTCGREPEADLQMIRDLNLEVAGPQRQEAREEGTITGHHISWPLPKAALAPDGNA